MTLFKPLISLLLIAGCAGLANGQQTVFDEEETVVYKEAVYGGVMLHNSGWGLTMSYKKNISVFKARLLELNIVGMKHPKELRSYNASYDDAGSYIYGKLNSVHVVRPLWGARKVLNDKIRESGVQIGYSWGVGPSLAFAKPVYLEINKSADNFIGPIVVEEYDPEEHNVNNIYGRASWFRGLEDMKLYPGLAAKFSVFAEFAPDRTAFKELEVGATFDAYGEELPIMANELNKQFFFNFFVAIHFGKKYN